MSIAESNRAQMAPEAVARRIRAHVRWLEKEIERTDRDLDEAIKASSAFEHNEALLRSVPGVGPVLARTLLAELPELGTITGDHHPQAPVCPGGGRSLHQRFRQEKG